MSMLNREQSILVVIDIQERLAAAMARREQVVRKTALLVRAARIVGMPIVVTRQNPKGLGELDPMLEEVRNEVTAGVHPAGREVDKMSFDCFCEPGFSEAIAVTGRRQVLLTGMETHICVCQTALAGLAGGFDVHVASDACCSRDQDSHRSALARLSHAGAVVTTAESAAYELVGCAGTDEFRALLAAVKAAG